MMCDGAVVSCCSEEKKGGLLAGSRRKAANERTCVKVGLLASSVILFFSFFK